MHTNHFKATLLLLTALAFVGGGSCDEPDVTITPSTQTVYMSEDTAAGLTISVEDDPVDGLTLQLSGNEDGVLELLGSNPYASGAGGRDGSFSDLSLDKGAKLFLNYACFNAGTVTFLLTSTGNSKNVDKTATIECVYGYSPGFDCEDLDDPDEFKDCIDSQTPDGGTTEPRTDAGQTDPTDAGQTEPRTDAGQTEPRTDAGQTAPDAGQTAADAGQGGAVDAGPPACTDDTVNANTFGTPDAIPATGTPLAVTSGNTDYWAATAAPNSVTVFDLTFLREQGDLDCLLTWDDNGFFADADACDGTGDGDQVGFSNPTDSPIDLQLEVYLPFVNGQAQCTEYELDVTTPTPPPVDCPVEDVGGTNHDAQSAYAFPAGGLNGLNVDVAKPDFYTVTVPALTVTTVGFDTTTPGANWTIRPTGGFDQSLNPVMVLNNATGTTATDFQVQVRSRAFCMEYGLAHSELSCAEDDTNEPNDNVNFPPALTSGIGLVVTGSSPEDYFEVGTVAPGATVSVEMTLAQPSADDSKLSLIDLGTTGGIIGANTIALESDGTPLTASWTNDTSADVRVAMLYEFAYSTPLNCADKITYDFTSTITGP